MATSRNIVRTVCVFSKDPGEKDVARLHALAGKIRAAGFEIQTLRICTDNLDAAAPADSSVMLSVGGQSPQHWERLRSAIVTQKALGHLDLTGATVDADAVAPLFQLMKTAPEATFRFAFGFNLPANTPFFPSAKLGVEGFAVGLQTTDLAEDAATPETWFARMADAWQKLELTLKNEPGYLGIDSSIAPLFSGNSSLVEHVRRWSGSWSRAATTDIFVRMTSFIKKNNPHPVGLNGIMFPCLEDFALADEYEAGNFSIERNIFLSLHSALGIDTYPIGIDETPERVAEILRLVQALSKKYSKPLAVRLVSDGKAKIGERTDFKNQYLKDVIIRQI